MQNDDPKRRSETRRDDDIDLGVVSAEPWTLVTIDLTPEQQKALERLTGEKMVQLKLLVEQLIDLGDLVAN